ncbi:MAG: hypothetical protein P4L31_02695 [Candidatus Babeliales bacterium]|nr:hypothetical protein [Candidatus Babeliales bacterium]
MKLQTHFLVALILASFLSLQAHTDQTTAVKAGYLDIVEDINPFDQEFEQKEKEVQQVVFGAFATIAQNLFNIVQNPKNPTNVANNVAAMIASIVSTGMTITRNLPAEVTIQERQQFVDELMITLERELKALGVTKRALETC